MVYSVTQNTDFTKTLIKFHLGQEVMQAFTVPIFTKNHKWSAALRTDLLYRISPTSDNKYGKQSTIYLCPRVGMALNVQIFTKLAKLKFLWTSHVPNVMQIRRKMHKISFIHVSKKVRLSLH
jgi:hypothetical protein